MLQLIMKYASTTAEEPFADYDYDCLASRGSNLSAARTVIPECSGFGLGNPFKGRLPIKLPFFNLIEPLCFSKCTSNPLCTAVN